MSTPIDNGWSFFVALFCGMTSTAMALAHSFFNPANGRSSYDFITASPSQHRVISTVCPPHSRRKRRRIKVALCCKSAAESHSNSVELPTMSDIMRVGNAQKVKLQLQSWGPLFRVMATSVVTGEEVGRANGFITIWFGGKTLHLDSIRMTRQAFKMQSSIFGMGLLVGAVAIRHGYDSHCKTAELLAINDSELYHSKLVRFYTRMGFNIVYEVKGSSLADIIHMLAWGGIGTRMDAGIEELLTKWSSKFRPCISACMVLHTDGIQGSA